MQKFKKILFWKIYLAYSMDKNKDYLYVVRKLLQSM